MRTIYNINVVIIVCQNILTLLHSSHKEYANFNFDPVFTREIVHPIDLNFVPGVDRRRPYSIEIVVQVPPKSFLEISVEFEYSLLKWLEYPPGRLIRIIFSAFITFPYILS